MDWLSLQIDQLEPSFIRPHPVALVAALAFGLFWLRAGPRVLPGRPGAWFGLVIGAAAYVPVLLWVQGRTYPRRIGDHSRQRRTRRTGWRSATGGSR